MSKSFIRKATEPDAEQIAKLISDELHDEPNLVNIKSQLPDPNSLTLVIEYEGQTRGFVSGFITKGNGIDRLELDLIAVSSESRKQGLGKSLVEAFVAEGVQLFSPYLVRALVRAGNEAMEKCMKSAGFQPEEKKRSLYVTSDRSQTPVTKPPLCDCVIVETFTYKGIWLEGCVNDQAIRFAKYELELNNKDIIGCLPSAEDAITLGSLSRSGFRRIDDYQWYSVQAQD